MNPKTLDKILDEHKKWRQSNGEEGQKADLWGADLREADLREADLCRADLREANLWGANLCGANLCEANLCRADLDYSAFPLWCGGLDIHIDDRQATQLLYHLIRNVEYSRNTSKGMKKLCKIKSLIKQANKFHRADECGKLRR
nr:MAG TPA: pentapeptide repeat protein [Caudoviricetes sp.]